MHCYICGSDYWLQARHIPCQCRVVTLCRLCALKSITHIIFRCSCGKCDFIEKYPHRLRILANRLQLSSAAREFMANGLALVESTSCLACQTST
jgi:hypothetical protein